MKRLLAAAALLGLPVLASPVQAGCCCFTVPGFKVNWCCHFQCCPCGCGQPGQAGPWYLYWPLEAHFQTPAPCSYPFWPAPMVLPGQAAEVQGTQPLPPAAGMMDGGHSMSMAPAPTMPAATGFTAGPANFHAPVQPTSYS